MRQLRLVLGPLERAVGADNCLDELSTALALGNSAIAVDEPRISGYILGRRELWSRMAELSRNRLKILRVGAKYPASSSEQVIAVPEYMNSKFTLAACAASMVSGDI